MIKDYIVNVERNNIMASMLVIGVGTLLLINPVDTINICIIALGILLVISSIFDFIGYFRIDPMYRIFHFGIFKGIANILIGLLMILNSGLFVHAFPVVLGVIVLLCSIYRIQMAVNLKMFDIDWGLGVLVSLVTMILSIFLISNPNESFVAMLTIVGVFLIIFEVINIVYSLYTIGKAKKINKQLKVIFEKESK